MTGLLATELAPAALGGAAPTVRPVPRVIGAPAARRALPASTATAPPGTLVLANVRASRAGRGPSATPVPRDTLGLTAPRARTVRVGRAMMVAVATASAPAATASPQPVLADRATPASLITMVPTAPVSLPRSVFSSVS